MLHRYLSRFLNLYRVDAGDMALMRAQHAAYARRIPFLYFILVTNSLASAWTFVRFAPPLLSIGVPLVLFGVCVWRGIWFWRTRDVAYSDAELLRQVKRIVALAGVLTLGFTAWGLAMFHYGDDYARGQMIFCMALNVITCAFCLMHLRAAALSIITFADIPFSIFFFFEGHETYRAIAINLVLVSAAMVAVLMAYNRDFVRLVGSRAEMRRLSDENFRIANIDSLTDLPNRRWFFANLEEFHRQAAARKTRFAVGIIDLDGFKPVNDTYGHATGDRLLVEVGKRLRELRDGGAAGSCMTVARLGGDEFAVLVSGDVSDDALKIIGRRIHERLRLPYNIGAASAQIGCSMGFAIYPDHGDTFETVFERADYALYFAKRQLRGETVLFSAEHQARIRDDNVIENALQAADIEREFSLVFQPVLDVGQGRVVGFEALARWDSPSLGPVSPAVFIPAAERTGLILSLTRSLLIKALKEAARWPEDIGLAFNLSAHDLCSPESILAIIAAVNASGVPARRIDFEITETATARDFAAARMGVDTLKALGAGISLDDFGTGFSSLSHVHSLPLDTLKVDRSFIQDICDNPASVKIVKSLANLCADMGLTCVVEGVETAEQLALLRTLNCDRVQGYHFARPMKPEAIAEYLAAGAGRAVA
ncbi:putative bifunctional diguanylate cyclase/phosphodiesterase [Asticcacaulis solisilvae]|uniref:putative bifunctional diguanylate cyclase/phosphodiesterase n=1 Tax=Asticcacaulis solisilvae TaxID=1217274 RepID=UPI003FD817D5